MKPTPCIWLTGLSRSGKTTIAHGVARHLRSQGHTAEILDGKVIRRELGDIFGYSKDERLKVVRALCAMAKLLTKHGVWTIVTSITPHQDSRDFARSELDPYVELYIESSVEICAARDPDGLYRRAQRGDIRHFIGVDDPFELPKTADLRINTESESPEQSLERALALIRSLVGQTCELR